MSRRPHLFVMDPLGPIDPSADTTFDFLLENQDRGRDNWMCEIHHLHSDGAKGYARARPLQVWRPQQRGDAFFKLGEDRTLAFDDFEVVWMRKDPPVDDAFMLATMMLDRHDAQRTLLMNNPAGLRVANEKLWGLFAAHLGPRTKVATDLDVLCGAIDAWGSGVLKPIGRAGGAGIMVFEKGDRNARSAADVLTDYGRRPAVVQEYLPQARDGDKRVILLGGEAIGAVLRVPQKSDHRANMHVGGSVQPVAVDERDREIAATLKPELLRNGLHFVGIDVIAGQLTEVNVTSPTGVQEIDRLDARTGSDRMRFQVMDYVDRLLRERGIL